MIILQTPLSHYQYVPVSFALAGTVSPQMQQFSCSWRGFSPQTPGTQSLAKAPVAQEKPRLDFTYHPIRRGHYSFPVWLISCAAQAVPPDANYVVYWRKNDKTGPGDGLSLPLSLWMCCTRFCCCWHCTFSGTIQSICTPNSVPTFICLHSHKN